MRIEGQASINPFDSSKSYQELTLRFRENTEKLLHLAKKLDFESRTQYSKLEILLFHDLEKLAPQDKIRAKHALEDIQKVSDTSHQMLLFEQQLKNVTSPQEYYHTEKLLEEAKEEQVFLTNNALSRILEWTL